VRPVLSDPLDPLTDDDPVAAVLAAYEDGRDLVLTTSGTTRRPRAVRRTTASWFDSFATVARMTGLQPDSRMWVPGPLAGTMNLFAAVLCRWVGAQLVPTVDDATHAHLTPTVLRRLLEGGHDLDGRRLTVAGDRLQGGLHARATARGARVTHYYGAAELSFVAWGRHETDLRRFPGVDVREVEGVLWVRSPFLAAVPTDHDGFATVGDRGAVGGDGRVVVHGRGEAAVLTGGVTVAVADVEAALRGAVTCGVVVVGMPHPELGEVVAAVIEEGGQVAAAHACARAELPGTQRPRLWFVADPLPRTPADKTDRAAVRALAAAGALRRVSPVGVR
jgi:acyl-coenzyme A synthetase/AMP-(fatty) acid ligase